MYLKTCFSVTEDGEIKNTDLTAKFLLLFDMIATHLLSCVCQSCSLIKSFMCQSYMWLLSHPRSWNLMSLFWELILMSLIALIMFGLRKRVNYSRKWM